MNKTIAAAFAGMPIAADLEQARPLLSQQMPVAQAGEVIAASQIERYTIQRRVAVLPLRGMLTHSSYLLERYLGWSTFAGIEQACAELMAHEDVSAIVMPVDSPGGYVVGMDAAADAIAALAAVKPVHVLVDPMCASAAYHLASQATDITVTSGSITGSIGVMRMSVSPVEPDNWGDQWKVHLSSHARAKNPDAMTETGLAEIQRSLDEVEATFLEYVARGRGIDLADLLSRLSVTDDPKDGGACFRAADAVTRGLADAQMTKAAFYAKIEADYAPAPQRQPTRGFAARVNVAKAKTRT